MSQPLVRVMAVVGLCLLIALAVPQLFPGDRDLRDFRTFPEAGRAHREGRNPYVMHEQPDAQAGIMPALQLETTSPNLNPPVSVYPFRLLADADPFALRNGLAVISALLYAGACVVLLKAYAWQRRPLVVLWLLAVSGFWYTLLLGQIYVPLFLLGMTALLLIEKGRSPLWAGILIGLVVAIKPNFAVWPLLLLLAGHRPLALTSFAVAAAISAVPLLVDGPEIYRQWLEAARDYPNAGFAINASLFAVATRLGVEAAGYAVAAVLTAAAAWCAWRWRLTMREASAWGVMLTLAVGPLTWVGYTLFMLPMLLARRNWTRWEIAVAATMLVPIGAGWPAGEVRLAGILLLSALFLKDAVEARRADSRTPVEALPNVTLAQAA